MRRLQLLALAGALAMSSTLAGCGSSTTESDLSFSYVGSADSGFIDQTLTIVNRGRSSVAPTLEIVAVDADGQEIPDIVVETAFGSDRGALVVFGGSNYDVLQFDGPARERVANVMVSVTSLRAVDLAPDTEPPTVEALAAGTVVSPSDMFDAVQITNDADVSFQVRVLYLEWEESAPGVPQQAASVTQVIYAATIDAVSRVSFDVAASAAAPVIDRVARGGGAASLKVIVLAN